MILSRSLQPVIILLGLAGLVLGGGASYAQTEADTTVRRAFNFRPSVLRVGVTLNDLIRTATNAADTRYSFQGDLAFGRFMLVGEYGVANTQQQNNPDRLASPYTYNSQGSFLRVGVDVNLLKDREANDYDAAGSILLFGLRFGRAQINDRLSYELVDSLWGTTVLTQQNNGLVATWAEMTAGVKVEVIKNLFLGYNLRFKFAQSFSDEPALLPYYIPGFGRSDRPERFGFDYSIFYRIPLRRRKARPILIRDIPE
ncbi:MAG: DUF6048 family protein [Tunicatimonas sp.]